MTEPISTPARLRETLDRALADYIPGIDRAVYFVSIEQVDMLAEFYLHNRADLSDALLREARAALGGVMTACDQGRMVAKTGVGGMTIEANIRGSVYMGVPAWPIEEARATLAKLRAHLGEKE